MNNLYDVRRTEKVFDIVNDCWRCTFYLTTFIDGLEWVADEETGDVIRPIGNISADADTIIGVDLTYEEAVAFIQGQEISEFIGNYLMVNCKVD